MLHSVHLLAASLLCLQFGDARSQMILCVCDTFHIMYSFDPLLI